jgi:protoporphyrinogen oxidase
MMWQAVAGILREKGVRVSMNAKVDKICWSKDTIDALEFTQNGTCLSAVGTDFLSSMPMKDLIQTLSPEAPVEVQRAAERLKYRDFITVALIINKRDVFPDNWLYINDPRIRLGRIQNFKNWSPFMVPDQEKTCLGLEYFCFEGDGLWNLPDQELIVLGKEELAKLGLVKADEVEDGTVVRKQKAYPLYDTASWESVSIIRNFLHRFKNLQLIGRNGMHRYNNQDHSMLTAMLAVENILGDNHNLWELDS